MDQNIRKINDLQIENTVKNLKANKFDVDVFDNCQHAMDFVKTYLNDHIKCASGGSQTLIQMGLIDELKSNAHINYLDRDQAIDMHQFFCDSINTDIYFMSANAVTMDGFLYNVDGNGNRVAALAFGPKKVFVIVGENKLVKDLAMADLRMQYIAAPCNNVRLNKDNLCTKVGHCVDCHNDTRICSSYLTTKRSHIRGRIHVLIIKESLGY